MMESGEIICEYLGLRVYDRA